MKIKKIKQFYIAYAHYGNFPVHIELITKDNYDVMKVLQPEDERLHCSTIHSDSTREDDPLIDIVAITEYQKLGQERAKKIDQEVINWLMDNGHMPKR